MKFKIRRTSYMWGNNCPQPCAKACFEGLDEWGRSLWSIEINTIEDLQNLIEEVGDEIIVSKDQLEIYDDYRE